VNVKKVAPFLCKRGKHVAGNEFYLVLLRPEILQNLNLKNYED